MSRRSLSGQRHKPLEAAGNGALSATVTLKCGHGAAGDPPVHHPSKRKSYWFCPSGCGLQEGRRAA